ncbi:DUF6745 domain-containing protein [Mycobacterium bourgelatii]|nr:hypothetical protein [Mycobacterium bourgelatii]MCV6975780.1 hypothetical protein [Mycobacterium bourgelatii]
MDRMNPAGAECELVRPTRPKQLTELTADQRERMAAFVAQRIDHARRTTPLTEDEWAAWEAGVRKCYELVGVPWPGVIVKVPSPVVGALAPPIAEGVVREIRNSKPGISLDSAVRSAVDAAGRSVSSVGDAPRVGEALSRAVRDVIDATRAGMVCPAFDQIPATPTHEESHSAVSRKIVRRCIREVFEPVLYAVPNVDGAIRGLLCAAVCAVSSARNWRVPLAGRGHVGFDVVWAFLRDACALDFGDETRESLRAIENAQSAECWWPFRDFVVVCDLPTEVHTETVDGRIRLHNADGPAVRWGDGWEIHAWHGTTVPRDLIENGWDTKRIMAERNAEVRRCAIERVGWHQFITTAGFRLIDQAPDPANPGQLLRLYKVPRRVLGYRARILLCVNATPERNGARRVYELSVPTTCRTALTAVAWSFDVPEQTYERLARAT